jgi:hypothetical protein
MKQKTRFFNRKKKNQAKPKPSRYAESFWHNNKYCSILWGYNEDVFGGAYIKRSEGSAITFFICRNSTIVPHPHISHITGEWRSRELADVFDAFHELIPLEHRDAVRRDVPF